MRLHSVYVALVHPIRRRILYLLSYKDLCVQELQAALALGQVTVSKHLQLLRSSGAVTVVKDGNRRCYRLNEDSLILAEQIKCLRRCVGQDPEFLRDAQQLEGIRPRAKAREIAPEPQVAEELGLESHLL